MNYTDHHAINVDRGLRWDHFCGIKRNQPELPGEGFEAGTAWLRVRRLVGTAMNSIGFGFNSASVGQNGIDRSKHERESSSRRFGMSWHRKC